MSNLINQKAQIIFKKPEATQGKSKKEDEKKVFIEKT